MTLSRPFWATLLAIGSCTWLASAAATAEAKEVFATGLTRPVAVATTQDGRVFVSDQGDPETAGDGRIVEIVSGELRPLAAKLDNPGGLVVWKESVYVVDGNRLQKVDLDGTVTTVAEGDALGKGLKFLVDVKVDEQGNLYASGIAGPAGEIAATVIHGVIYRVDQRGRVKELTPAGLQQAGAILNDGLLYALVTDEAGGELKLVRITDGEAVTLTENLGSPSGMTRDIYGRLYITDSGAGKVLAIPATGGPASEMAAGLKSPGNPGLHPSGEAILIPEMESGRIIALPAQIPGAEVDFTPLAIETVPAFEGMAWGGWEPESEDGVIVPLRPIVLTHANDDSGRTFLATQHGVINVFPKAGGADEASVFLDLTDRVVYSDKTNEEGFLGLAFHPDFASNGELYVYYTSSKLKPHTSVISRFRVDPSDPNKADPSSEEILMTIDQPYWNHNGGTVAFGPDGFLYIGLGDGGLANDPQGNGQNLRTLLGSVLRIDVDGQQDDKPYAIPADNPFVNREDAQPEIWAYGLRNVWRMAFDRETGDCWAADVGQNLFEEINILTNGGNYGWNIREGFHPFSPKGLTPPEGLTDPVWEYPHSVGRSVTGGTVYRGKKLPELVGAYIYGDYVSGDIWALWYDKEQGRVVANRPIGSLSLPILSFGEDEDGEIYLLTTSNTGQGVYTFAPTKDAK